MWCVGAIVNCFFCDPLHLKKTTTHFPIAGMSTAVIQVAALDYTDRCIPISMPVRLTRPPVLQKTGQYPWLILWMGFKNPVQKMSHPAASSSSSHILLQSRTIQFISHPTAIKNIETQRAGKHLGTTASMNPCSEVQWPN